MERVAPREGDVYEVVTIGGHSFTIYYGYYSSAERHNTEPLPIYPCFLTEPRFTAEGRPLVTRIQDACEHYTVSKDSDGDGWCADCQHFSGNHNTIGICQCEHRRLQKVAY